MIPEYINQAFQRVYLVAERVNDTANNNAPREATLIDIVILSSLAAVAFGTFAYWVWGMHSRAKEYKKIEPRIRAEEEKKAKIEEAQRIDRIAEAVADKLEKRLGK